MATHWGIISAGKISNDFVSAMKVLPKDAHRVIGIAARDKERSEEFAKKHKIPFAYGSYKDLLMNADIEVVYIGVLHPQHFEVAKLCLEHGKNVLCEKPLCMNFKETEELVKLAKKKKLFLMEAVWSRCFPAYDHVRKQLEKKTIGEVLFVDVQFGSEIRAERISKKKLGGGTVLDIGIYTLQLATLVLGGKPNEVKASGHVNAEGVDENMSCVLNYDKATAVLSTHSKVHLPNTALIVGTEGSILIKAPFWAPTKVKISRKKSDEKEVLDFPLPETDAVFNFRNSVGMHYEAAEVRRCLKEGLKESPLISHEDSLNLAKLEDEIRKQLGVHYPDHDL